MYLAGGRGLMECMTGESREWRLGHRPALDGLRGVAVLLVVTFHALAVATGSFEHGPLGSAGVMLFFPLSGFLITSLLLEELRDRGRVDLRRFYVHRALRLFPALAVVVLVFTAMQAASGVAFVPSLWPVILYVGNWAAATGGNLGVLNPTWSLAIEEQFYLLWPLVLLVSMRWRRGPMLVVVAGIIASTVTRFSLGMGDGGVRAYYGSDAQASSLLVGCLLALAVHSGRMPALRVPGWLVGAGALSLFGWAFASGNVATSLVVPTLVPVVGVVLIWAACSTLSGPLTWRWLRYLGGRSYALYLWHWPLLWIAFEAGVGPVGTVIVAVALSLAMAELSWRMVEAPCLRLRRRLDGQRSVAVTDSLVPTHAAA